MTTPVVESVRTVPLIIEQQTMYSPMFCDQDDSNLSDYENTGFPFDLDDENQQPRRGADPFRSQLDDIAQRHPQLAGHFDEFPFRRQSRPAHRAANPEEWFSGTGRPAAFDRFTFPHRFFDDDAAPQPAQAAAQQPTQQPTQQEHKQSSSEKQAQGANCDNKDQDPRSEPCKKDSTKAEPTEPPPVVPTNERVKGNIQQSQTVDLGQRQEAEAVNERNQRSMSAPPSDNRTGRRFVSSINIPIGGMSQHAMGGRQAKNHENLPPQPPAAPHAPKSNERVIPIHVEGRDEPVLPKNSAFTAPQPQPQPDRLFGQTANQFTRFVPPPAADQQQEEYKKRQAEAFEAEREDVTAKTCTNTSIDAIQSIQKDVSNLMRQVERFNGQPKDKQYMYLDEMLTRNLLKLDNIDTQGQEMIRQARKEAVRCIEKCLAVLDAKANANAVAKSGEVKKEEEVVEEEKMEVEGGGEKMEEGKEETKEETKEEAKVELGVEAVAN